MSLLQNSEIIRISDDELDERETEQRRIMWLIQKQRERDNEYRKTKMILEYELKRAEALKRKKMKSFRRSRSREKMRQKVDRDVPEETIMSRKLTDKGEPIFKGMSLVRPSESKLREIKVKIWRNVPNPIDRISLEREIVDPEEVVVKRRGGEGIKPIFNRVEIMERESVLQNNKKHEVRKVVSEHVGEKYARPEKVSERSSSSSSNSSSNSSQSTPRKYSESHSTRTRRRRSHSSDSDDSRYRRYKRNGKSNRSVERTRPSTSSHTSSKYSGSYSRKNTRRRDSSDSSSDDSRYKRYRKKDRSSHSRDGGRSTYVKSGSYYRHIEEEEEEEEEEDDRRYQNRRRNYDKKRSKDNFSFDMSGRHQYCESPVMMSYYKMPLHRPPNSGPRHMQRPRMRSMMTMPGPRMMGPQMSMHGPRMMRPPFY